MARATGTAALRTARNRLFARLRGEFIMMIT
jgi:hypothetical protein